jgi:hypothetical protein
MPRDPVGLPRAVTRPTEPPSRPSDSVFQPIDSAEAVCAAIDGSERRFHSALPVSICLLSRLGLGVKTGVVQYGYRWRRASRLDDGTVIFSVVVRKRVDVLVRRRGCPRVSVRTWPSKSCRDQSRSTIWRPDTG